MPVSHFNPVYLLFWALLSPLNAAHGGQMTGTVTEVTFKGMQYDIIVDFSGFKWLIQTTDHSPVGAKIGVKIDPDGFHIMKKSEYSGLYGDYSSYSAEYDELSADPEGGGQEDE